MRPVAPLRVMSICEYRFRGRTGLARLRRTDFRLLRDADRLGDRAAGRAEAGARRRAPPGSATRSCSSATRRTRPSSRPAPTCPTARSSRPRVTRLGAEIGIEVPAERAAAFGGSVVDWPAFPDSAAALAKLGERYRLAPITNCDDDLFAAQRRAARQPVHVGHHRPAGARLQAEHARVRAGLRDDRRPARADPARRAEPLPRSRHRQAARHDERLDRPPRGPARQRRDAAGRGRAPGRHVPRHGLVRRRRGRRR